MVRAAAFAAFALLSLEAAHAQEAIYTGTIKCDAIPAMDLRELNQRVTITRQGDRLTYIREFRTTDGSGAGARETATGTLAGNKATLTGGANVANSRGSSTTNLTSRFEVTLLNNTMELTGKQTWSSRNRSADRTCTATLRP